MASLRGVQFAMIISNPAFLPTPDDSRHDVHSGKDALLGMDDLDTIVTAAPGGDPLPSAPPTPAEQPMSSKPKPRINPLRLPINMLIHLMFHPAAFVPC